ncbi:MAG: type II toxin-antitoxin system HicB family antitoxin [Desulfacinum sp.]|jgi:predicted RNase H-like HicB family nuclease|nr:type II toxin-antitoxin system HicB family antitoxin [Desulfacinum sp.]
MRNEFTAVIEKDQDWYIAYCLEIPGANGMGKTKEECLENLADAIKLILEDRREDGLRGLPSDADSEIVMVQSPDWARGSNTPAFRDS